jgi:hypothetical protein
LRRWDDVEGTDQEQYNSSEEFKRFLNQPCTSTTARLLNLFTKLLGTLLERMDKGHDPRGFKISFVS